MSKPLLFKGIISSADKNVTIPSKFICPLTNNIMKNPVRIVGSKFPLAYEAQALETYFEENGYIDPQTKNDLGEDAQTTPDLSLKRQIEDFLNGLNEQSRAPTCKL